MEHTQGEIRRFIVNNFLFGQEDEQLMNNSSLLQSGTIDSTGVLELVVFLEETYSIKVEDEDLLPENLDSIENVAQFVERKLQN
ncbi:MAG: acyl carrier protein [Planctomycetota bacterium]